MTAWSFKPYLPDKGRHDRSQSVLIEEIQLPSSRTAKCPVRDNGITLPNPGFPGSTSGCGRRNTACGEQEASTGMRFEPGLAVGLFPIFGFRPPQARAYTASPWEGWSRGPRLPGGPGPAARRPFWRAISFSEATTLTSRSLRMRDFTNSSRASLSRPAKGNRQVASESLRQKTVPCVPVSRSERSAAICRASSRLMASPRPDPPGRPVLPGSKRWVRTASGMPDP